MQDNHRPPQNRSPERSSSSPPGIILASTSTYRARALKQLGLAFTTVSPGVEETPEPNESARALAVRLAQQKAAAVATRQPDKVVIGSDQTGVCEGRLLDKPGTVQANIDMLQRLSGKTADFYTAVATHAPSDRQQVGVVVTSLSFRTLTLKQIEAYVAYDQALDCAGGFKVESLGIGLFERVSSEDPSALIGLPLIMLTAQLHQAGVDILNHQT